MGASNLGVLHLYRATAGGLDPAITGRVDHTTEIGAAQRKRPNTRFVLYDHTFGADRAWFRFTLTCNDMDTGETRARVYTQVYRAESGKLAETWLMLQELGTESSDSVAQEHWTSTPPNSHS